MTKQIVLAVYAVMIGNFRPNGGIVASDNRGVKIDEATIVPNAAAFLMSRVARNRAGKNGRSRTDIADATTEIGLIVGNGAVENKGTIFTAPCIF